MADNTQEETEALIAEIERLQVKLPLSDNYATYYRDNRQYWIAQYTRQKETIQQLRRDVYTWQQVAVDHKSEIARLRAENTQLRAGINVEKGGI